MILNLSSLIFLEQLKFSYDYSPYSILFPVSYYYSISVFVFKVHLRQHIVSFCLLPSLTISIYWLEASIAFHVIIDSIVYSTNLLFLCQLFSSILSFLSCINHLNISFSFIYWILIIFLSIILLIQIYLVLLLNYLR